MPGLRELKPNLPALLQGIRGIDCRQKNVRSVTNQLGRAISALDPEVIPHSLIAAVGPPHRLAEEKSCG
jgi:hypothetical protein